MITYIERTNTMTPDCMVEKNGVKYMVQTMYEDEYDAIGEECERIEIAAFEATAGEYIDVYRVEGYTIVNIQMMGSNVDFITLLGHPEAAEVEAWYNATNEWNTEEVVEFIQEHVGPKPTTH